MFESASWRRFETRLITGWPGVMRVESAGECGGWRLVFDYGTRFVRQICVSSPALHQKRVGTSVLAVVPRFIAMQEVLEAGFLSVCIERQHGAGDGFGVRILLGGFAIDALAFDGPHALHTPGGGDHFLELQFFMGGLRVELRV